MSLKISTLTVNHSYMVFDDQTNGMANVVPYVNPNKPAVYSVRKLSYAEINSVPNLPEPFYPLLDLLKLTETLNITFEHILCDKENNITQSAFSFPGKSMKTQYMEIGALWKNGQWISPAKFRIKDLNFAKKMFKEIQKKWSEICE